MIYKLYLSRFTRFVRQSLQDLYVNIYPVYMIGFISGFVFEGLPGLFNKVYKVYTTRFNIFL